MSYTISRPTLSGYGASALSMNFESNIVAISNAYTNSGTGSVSIFTYTPPGPNNTGNSWSSAITINGTSNSNFGQSISMNYDGTRIAIGAPNIGKVYIYDWTGSGWNNYSNVINCPISTSSNNFGYSVSLSADLGDRVAIGAPGINTACIYELKNSQWTQTWLHTENTITSNITCATSVNSTGNVSVYSQYNNYGFSVALSLYGDFIAIGAPGTDLSSVTSSNSNHTGSPNDISYNSVGVDDVDMAVVGQLGFVQVYKGGLTNTQSWLTSNNLVGQTLHGDAGVHKVDFTYSPTNGTTNYWKEAWSMPRMGFMVDISDDGLRVVAGSPSFSMIGTQNALYMGKIELFEYNSTIGYWKKSLSPLFGSIKRGCMGHSFKLNSSNDRIIAQDLDDGGFSVMDYSGNAWYQNGVRNDWMSSNTPTYGDTILTSCTITNGSLVVSGNPYGTGEVRFYDFLLTNTLIGNTLIGGYMAAEQIFLGPSDNSISNDYNKKISFGGTYADNFASLCTIERRTHDTTDTNGASELLLRHKGETDSDQIRLNAPELIFQVGGSDTVIANMHINKEGSIGIGSDLYADTALSSTGDHWQSRSYCTAGLDISSDVQIREKINVNYPGRTSMKGKDGASISRLNTRNDNDLVLTDWASSSQNVTLSSSYKAYEFTSGNSYIQASGGSTYQKGARFGLWLNLQNEHSTYTASNSKGQVLCALGTIPTPSPIPVSGGGNRYSGCSLYLYYNSASDRGLKFWLGETDRYYTCQFDFVKNRWYCIDIKFPGQYSGTATTSLQPIFYTSNAPSSIVDTRNHILLIIDGIGKNLSVSGSGSANVSGGSIYAPNGYWFGGNSTDSTNDGYGINNVYMGLMYIIGGSGHQSAQPSVLYQNGPPPETLCVGGDTVTGGKIGIGTTLPAYELDVTGDINFTGNIYQNSNLYSIWTESGSDIYYDSGNVGIGTTTPTETLDVNGVLNLRGGSVTQDSSVDSGYASNTYIRFGEAGSGSDFAYLRQIGGTNSQHLALDFHDDVGDARFSIRNVVSTTNPDGSYSILKVEGGGNIGIGISDPVEKLHVYRNTSGESNVHIQAYSDYSGDRAALYLGTPHHNDPNAQPKCAIIADAVGWSRADLHFCVETTQNNGSAYRASTSNSRMMIDGLTGYVGIGTTNPTSAILHVNGSKTTNLSAYGYLASTGAGTNPSGANADLSIYASNRIAASQFNAFSDSRIKKNVTDINDSSALDKIRLLEPKIYNYIDEKQRGTSNVYGFIAQEVANVLPYAVTVGHGDIPNILTNSNVIVTENSNVLELHLDTPVEGLTLSNTSNINITTDKNTYLTVPVLSFSGSNVITIENRTEFSNVTGAYIHGEHILDFHNLNKDAIWSVATAALQEVDRQLQAEKTKVATLETQVADLLARVSALENN
jgi:hypothetical protein